jgi:opacity protein-like surface antigen
MIIASSSRWSAWTIALALLPSAAFAQRPAPVSPAPLPVEDARGYVEVNAQSAFGNVTSQSFGGEVGFRLRPNVQVFFELATARDVSTPDVGTAAQLIANSLSQGQSGVGFSVKSPATFGVGGARYLFPIPDSKLQPYVLGGLGAAKVTRNVKFTVNGTDVTANLAQLGVVLGGDLSGSITKPMITLGGGIVYPVWQRVIADFEFRYGRIFADDQGINLSRAGLGIGIRF